MSRKLKHVVVVSIHTDSYSVNSRRANSTTSHQHQHQHQPPAPPLPRDLCRFRHTHTQTYTNAKYLGISAPNQVFAIRIFKSVVVDAAARKFVRNAACAVYKWQCLTASLRKYLFFGSFFFVLGRFGNVNEHCEQIVSHVRLHWNSTPYSVRVDFDIFPSRLLPFLPLLSPASNRGVSILWICINRIRNLIWVCTCRVCTKCINCGGEMKCNSRISYKTRSSDSNDRH